MGRAKGSDVRHPCGDCDKTFTRRDHLQRHRLNHATASFACTIAGCGRNFVRQDLLTRHLERHAKTAELLGHEGGPLPPSRHASRRPSVAARGAGDAQGATAPPGATPESTYPGQMEGLGGMGMGQDDETASSFDLDRSMAGILASMGPGRPPYQQPALATDYQSIPPPNHHPLNQSSAIAGPSSPTAAQPLLPDWNALPSLSHPELFSNDLSLYDLTYDINPTANQAAESYEWLFSAFSPSTGLVHEDALAGGGRKDDWPWMQAPFSAPVPSTPKDHAASLTTAIFDSLSRLLPLHNYPDHPAFSHETLQANLAAYFAHFDAQLPILHKPLFDISTESPHLLLAMLCIGAWFAPERQTCEMWQQVAKELGGLVVMSDDFVDPNAGISLLQTLILLEMHGKLMSNRPSHTKAAIMHSAYVNIARRTKIFLPKATPASDPSSADSLWRAAMLDETGRRCAYALFIMDSAHSAMFHHSGVLSAFELRLDLPVPDAEWNAPNGDKWHALRFDPARRPPPPFAESLKASLLPGGVTSASSAFATSVILHGLISISHDVARKDNVLLGIDSDERGGSKWRAVLAKALDSYKSRLEASCSARYGPQLLWSGVSLQSVAHIGLVSDILDLQVFAGAPAIFGQKVSRPAYEKASQSIREWVQSKDAAEATWRSLIFLRAWILRRLEGGPEDREPGAVSDLPHLKWCMYIAALVCWSYGYAAAEIPFEYFGSSTGVEVPPQMLSSEWYLSEALAYCDALSFRTPTELDEADDRMKMRTSGLICFVLSEMSDPRWELEREAGALLTRLLVYSERGDRV